MGGGEASGESSRFLPAGGTFQKPEFEFLNSRIGGHGWGEGFQLLEGIGKHTKVGVAHGALGASEVIPKFRYRVHTGSYHKRREN